MDAFPTIPAQVLLNYNDIDVVLFNRGPEGGGIPHEKIHFDPHRAPVDSGFAGTDLHKPGTVECSPQRKVVRTGHGRLRWIRHTVQFNVERFPLPPREDKFRNQDVRIQHESPGPGYHRPSGFTNPAFRLHLLGPSGWEFQLQQNISVFGKFELDSMVAVPRRQIPRPTGFFTHVQNEDEGSSPWVYQLLSPENFFDENITTSIFIT